MDGHGTVRISTGSLGMVSFGPAQVSRAEIQKKRSTHPQSTDLFNSLFLLDLRTFRYCGFNWDQSENHGRGFSLCTLIQQLRNACIKPGKNLSCSSLCHSFKNTVPKIPPTSSTDRKNRKNRKQKHQLFPEFAESRCTGCCRWKLAPTLRSFKSAASVTSKGTILTKEVDFADGKAAFWIVKSDC